MAERFLVLRGTHVGPLFLARPARPDDADLWTEDRAEAWRFSQCLHAAMVQETIVARDGIAVAVVPERG